MYWGKLIAGTIGLLTGGVFGLLLGLLVGHFFDRGLRLGDVLNAPQQLAKVRQQFFKTTFLLLGHLAKADGRISEQEIDQTEQIIAQLRLNAEQRQQAIDLFKQGSAPGFAVDAAVSEFQAVCGRHPQLAQTLLAFLLTMVLADQQVDEAEHRAFTHIGGQLGFSAAQLEQFMSMARAQGSFHQRPGEAQGQHSLADAYAALGISESATDAEVKRAYRKQMSANHPDKLIAKGVPEEMVKLATEKSQDIQAAYEQLRNARGMR